MLWQSHADPNGNTDGNGYCNCLAYSHSYSYCYCDGDSYGYSDVHAYTDANTYFHTETNPDAKRYGFPKAAADATASPLHRVTPLNAGTREPLASFCQGVKGGKRCPARSA